MCIRDKFLSIQYVSMFVAVEEIINFTQTDLVPEDVMLLDAWDTLFLWIGDFSNREERKQAVNLAINYLRTGKKLSFMLIKIKIFFHIVTT